MFFVGDFLKTKSCPHLFLCAPAKTYIFCISSLSFFCPSDFVWVVNAEICIAVVYNYIYLNIGLTLKTQKNKMLKSERQNQTFCYLLSTGGVSREGS